MNMYDSGSGGTDSGAELARPMGRPFGEDYADRRTDLARREERLAARRQVARLSQPQLRDPARTLMIDTLQARRDLRRADETVTRLVAISRSEGFEILAVSGEILVRRDALRGTNGSWARSLLNDRGFVEDELTPTQTLVATRPDVSCPELAAKVARFVGPDLDADALTELTRLLRTHGVAASVNHVAPLAAVVKGKGGPEFSNARAVFDRSEPIDRDVTVAIIDTGIAEEQRSDGWLQYDDIDRRKDNIDETDRFWGPTTTSLNGGGDGYLDAASGHGTFVAGIVQRICPRADIRVYSGVDSDGVGGEFRIGCAMIRAVRDGANILNLSLGSQTLDDAPPIGLEAALDIIGDIERETGREVLVVAAAGNDGDTRPCWPAAFRRVVSVAALYGDGSPAADWSTHGPWVDCSTVGVGVSSTFLPGEESPDFDEYPETFQKDSWAVWTGTSFAAPQIVGAIARVCVDRGLSARQALAALLAQGVEVPDFGRALEILPGE